MVREELREGRGDLTKVLLLAILIVAAEISYKLVEAAPSALSQEGFSFILYRGEYLK